MDYMLVDTGDGVGRSTRIRSRRCCRLDTEGRAFNFVVGIVICANAILLGLQADMHLLSGVNPETKDLETDMDFLGVHGSEQDRLEAELKNSLKANWKIEHMATSYVNAQDIAAIYKEHGAYTICDVFFVVFFIIEIGLRFCDFRCNYFKHQWFSLDFIVLLQCLLDIFLPVACFVISVPHPVLMAVRTLRVLRILRIFRVCGKLGIIVGAFGRALSTIAWVGVLIVVIDFVFGIILTCLIGNRAYLWGDQASDIDERFGSIGRSMQTLFAIMTLSGWDHIALVLSDVLPQALVIGVIVLYIMLCSFTMVGLVVGVIGDSFMAAHRHRERLVMHSRELRRMEFEASFASVLSSSEHKKKGFMSRDEFSAAIDSHPAILESLCEIDVFASSDELLQLFDRLIPESEAEDAIKINSLVEAVSHLSGVATAPRVFEMKHLLNSIQRDFLTHKSSLSSLREEVTSGYLRTSSEATGTCVEDVKRNLGSVEKEVATVRSQLANVGDLVEKLHKQHEFAKIQESKKQSEIDTMRSNLVGLTLKFDELAKSVPNQHAMDEKIGSLAAKFSDQFATSFASKFAAEFTAQIAAQALSRTRSSSTGVVGKDELKKVDNEIKSRTESAEHFFLTESSLAVSDQSPAHLGGSFASPKSAEVKQHAEFARQTCTPPKSEPLASQAEPDMSLAITSKVENASETWTPIWNDVNSHGAEEIVESTTVDSDCRTSDSVPSSSNQPSIDQSATVPIISVPSSSGQGRSGCGSVVIVKQDCPESSAVGRTIENEGIVLGDASSEGPFQIWDRPVNEIFDALLSEQQQSSD